MIPFRKAVSAKGRTKETSTFTCEGNAECYGGQPPKAYGSGHQVCSVLRICINRSRGSTSWKAKLRKVSELQCYIASPRSQRSHTSLCTGIKFFPRKQTHHWVLSLLNPLCSQLWKQDPECPSFSAFIFKWLPLDRYFHLKTTICGLERWFGG